MNESTYRYGELIQYRFNDEVFGFFMGYKGKKKEVAWVIWSGDDFEVAELVCTLRRLIK